MSRGSGEQKSPGKPARSELGFFFFLQPLKCVVGGVSFKEDDRLDGGNNIASHTKKIRRGGRNRVSGGFLLAATAAHKNRTHRGL